MQNYIKFELFLILSIGHLLLNVINLTKIKN